MKKQVISYLFLALLGFMFGCDKIKEGDPPQLPPLESMAPDFSMFDQSKKAAPLGFDAGEATYWNFAAAGLTVAVWNSVLYTTLVVPVIAFEYAFAHTPEFLGESKWSWQYQLDGLYSQYSAELTGEIRDNDIKWEMYVSCSGANAFDRFLWFEGTSDLDASGGEWTLYHSPEFPEEVITIDWSASEGVLHNVVYSYVRELDNSRDPEPFNGSTLEYGIYDGTNLAYYNIHYYAQAEEDFVDVNIELDLDTSEGRIKASNWAGGDTDWHCWNADLEDMECP